LGAEDKNCRQSSEVEISQKLFISKTKKQREVDEIGLWMCPIQGSGISSVKCQVYYPLVNMYMCILKLFSFLLEKKVVSEDHHTVCICVPTFNSWTSWLLTDFHEMYEGVSKSFLTGENHKWYSSLPLGAVVSLFCESV